MKYLIILSILSILSILLIQSNSLKTINLISFILKYIIIINNFTNAYFRICDNFNEKY
jgi:hypothetical protein